MLCWVDSDGYEFQIVSLTNKEWQFEASTHDVSHAVKFTDITSGTDKVGICW